MEFPEEMVLLALLHEKLHSIYGSELLDSSNIIDEQENKKRQDVIDLIEDAKKLLEKLLPEKDARIIQKEHYMMLKKE